MLPLTDLEQNVDFSYLYHRHQDSLYMTEHAASAEPRQAHRELADRYRARIVDLKPAGSAAVAA